jgi:hypothetical protein
VATYTLELERSETLLQEAIALGEPLADTWSLGFAFCNLGVIEMKQNRLDRAWAWIEECQTVSAWIGNTFGIACALFRLSWGKQAFVPSSPLWTTHAAILGERVFTCTCTKHRIEASRSTDESFRKLPLLAAS